MAEANDIQIRNVSAIKALARENDKLGCLLETLKDRETLHLEDRDLDGLRYQLEDLRAAIDGVLMGQIEFATMNALATLEAAKEAKEAVRQTA